METSPISTCRNGACPLLAFSGHHVFISSFPCFPSLHWVFIPLRSLSQPTAQASGRFIAWQPCSLTPSSRAASGPASSCRCHVLQRREVFCFQQQFSGSISLLKQRMLISAHVVTSQPPDAEALGNMCRQPIDTCTSADLDDGELQSYSLSEHLFCIERITRK
jgi:hypothetical protein